METQRGGTEVVFGGAGGKAGCLGGLGLLWVGTEVAAEAEGYTRGEDDVFSLLESLKSSKAWDLLG